MERGKRIFRVVPKYWYFMCYWQRWQKEAMMKVVLLSYIPKIMLKLLKRFCIKHLQILKTSEVTELMSIDRYTCRLKNLTCGAFFIIFTNCMQSMMQILSFYQPVKLIDSLALSDVLHISEWISKNVRGFHLLCHLWNYSGILNVFFLWWPISGSRLFFYVAQQKVVIL